MGMASTPEPSAADNRYRCRLDSADYGMVMRQGTDLVALAGRSLRAHLAGREIESVASTPIDIRRNVLRAAVNVCLHCLETGKNVLPTSGWASGLSGIVEDHYPQLFIVSITAALGLTAEDAAAALEAALISLCKAALSDALHGANRVRCELTRCPWCKPLYSCPSAWSPWSVSETVWGREECKTLARAGRGWGGGGGGGAILPNHALSLP